MSTTKKIYIRDEHQAALQEFSDDGGNASELFAEALSGYIERKRRRTTYKRMVLRVQDRTGNVWKKAFRGRVLLALTGTRQRQFRPGVQWAVVETEKGRVVVVTAPRGSQGECVDSFEVFDSLDALWNCDRVPEDIKSMAIAQLGDDPIQELDI